MILPGHPFYGYKVKILQRGCTSTMNWVLISNPFQEEFHYRIPERWLSKEAPKETFTKHTDKTIIQFPIAFNSLQKLTRLIQIISHKYIDSPIGTEKDVGLVKNVMEISSEQEKKDKASRHDLETHSTTSKKSINHKTVVPIISTK